MSAKEISFSRWKFYNSCKVF